jgi:hypothetical protein
MTRTRLSSAVIPNDAVLTRITTGQRLVQSDDLS